MIPTTHLILGLSFLGLASLEAASLLTPGDTIFAYDLDANSSIPGDGEAAGMAVDGDSATKYLNFGKRHSGIIVTPGASTAQSFTLTTANDDDRRDPAGYLLFGTNDTITSTNHSNGFSDDWTLIGNGTLSLPSARQTTGAPVNLGNSASFSSYWMVFPALRDAGGTNSMQIADLQMFTDLNAAGSTILGAGNPALATSWDSDFPGGEPATNLIDGTSGAKHLNFGEERSAFWVVPSAGLTTVRSFAITTANDSPERDPSSWRLLGQAGDGSWSEIDSGALSLTDDREVEGAAVVVSNSTAYSAYRMEFDTLKDAGSANSMQIGEIQFYDVVPEPSTSLLAAGGVLGLLARRRRR